MRPIHRRLSGLALVSSALVLSLTLPAAAQDDATAAAGLEGMTPAEIGGIPAQVNVFSLDTLMAQLDPENPDMATAITAVEALQDGLGVAPQDIYLGIIDATDYEAGRGVLAIALAVPGADGTSLRDPVVELRDALFPDRTSAVTGEFVAVDTELGGKPVTLREPELLADGAYENGDHIVYAVDHVAILIGGSEAEALELLEALP